MISIRQYVCNIIAGNSQISTLYYQVDRARDIENKDNRLQRFTTKISFQGIGTNVYRSSQLVRLENISYVKSYNEITNEIEDGRPTLDQYIILLLKGRNAIRGLYQACCRANISREGAKVFCYTFNNPYGPILTNVNRDCLQFKNSFDFIKFFCECEKRRFDPLLVFNGLSN